MKYTLNKFKVYELLSIIGFGLFGALSAYQGDIATSVISVNALIWVFAYKQLRSTDAK